MGRVRNSRWGRRIASWPSAAVVAASYVLILAVLVLLPEDTAEVAAFLGPALVVVYCLLRTTRRGDVIRSWVAPSAVSTIAHDITSVPRWTVALPLLLLVLAVLADDDMRERRERAQPA